MPSATRLSSSACPRSMMPLSRTRSPSLLPTCAVKLRSILTTSIGNCRRYDSDAYPVPKSSRARTTPSALICWSVRETRSSEASSVLSVSSSVSRLGMRADDSSARQTWRKKSGWWSWRAETVTAICNGPPGGRAGLGVPRHLQRAAVEAVEVGRLPARLIEHPFAEADDEAGLLCERDEFAGRELAECR